MTYASQQLADALQKLAQESNRAHGYATRERSTSVEATNVEIPPAVADFLKKTSQYRDQTKSVNIGHY